MTTQATLPPTPFSTLPAEPGLADVLSAWKKDLLLSFNCHALGTVRGVGNLTSQQTVNATINYQKSFLVPAPNATGQYVEKLVPYPLMVDCPAIFLGGGPGALTFPVAVGDECLVLFNDRDINNWFAGQNTVAPLTGRLHSFSDGIILVGLRSLANALAGYDATRPSLRGNKAGTTYLSVGSSSFAMTNGTNSLNSVLSNLTSTLTALNTLLASSWSAGSFSLGATAYAGGTAAIVTDIGLAVTAINNLLATS